MKAIDRFLDTGPAVEILRLPDRSFVAAVKGHPYHAQGIPWRVLAADKPEASVSRKSAPPNLYGVDDHDSCTPQFCLATHKGGLCKGQHRTGTGTTARPIPTPKLTPVPAAPAAKTAQQAQTETTQIAGYQRALLNAQNLAQVLGVNHTHAAVGDYARALHTRYRTIAAADRARAVAQKRHDTVVARNAARLAHQQALIAAAAAKAAAARARRALVTHAHKTRTAPSKPSSPPLVSPSTPGNPVLGDHPWFALYAQPRPADAGLYALAPPGYHACQGEQSSSGATDTDTDESEPPDEDTRALIEALARFDDDDSGFSSSAWDEDKHPRVPKGLPGGGRFLSLVDRLHAAIKEHREGGSKGDPFHGFSREQLRRAGKARGVQLRRGADRDEISKALLDDLHSGAKSRAGNIHGPKSVREPKRDLKAEHAGRLTDIKRRIGEAKDTRHPLENLADIARMDRWHVGTARPGRTGLTTTKREQAVKNWSDSLERAQHRLAERTREVEKTADSRDLTGSQRKRFIDVETLTAQDDVDYYRRTLETWRKAPPHFQGDDIDAPFLDPRSARLVQPMNADHPLDVYGDMLHIEHSDEITHHHMRDLEEIDPAVHHLVAASLARSNSDHAGVYVGSQDITKLDDLGYLAHKPYAGGMGDGRGRYEEVGGIVDGDTVAIGHTTDEWTIRNSQAQSHSTAQHEMGHELDRTLGRDTAPGGWASNGPEWAKIYEEMRAQHGPGTNPYYLEPSGDSGRREAFAEAFSLYTNLHTRLDQGDPFFGRKHYEPTSREARIQRIRVALDIPESAAAKMVDYFDDVIKQARKEARGVPA